MKDEYVFKIKGMDKVMTYNKLMEVGMKVHPRCIKIYDTRGGKVWISDYLTIKEKFR